MDEDTSSRFVNSLVKSIQALCNGYIEFDTTIEVVGHIHLKIDRRKRLDYVLTEEVSKSLTEGATVFNSHSYHSHPPAPTKSPAESAQNQRKSNLNKNHENDPMALSSLPVVPNASKPDSHSASASRLGENSDSSHSGSYSGSHSQDTTISSAKADSLERRRKMAPSSHRTMSPTAKRSRNEDTSLRNSSLEVIEIKEEPEDEPAVYFGDNSQMGGSQDIQTPDFSNVVMESLDRVGQAEGTQLTGEAKPLAQPFPVMLHSNSMPSATASSSLPGQSSDPQSAPSTSAGVDIQPAAVSSATRDQKDTVDTPAAPSIHTPSSDAALQASTTDETVDKAEEPLAIANVNQADQPTAVITLTSLLPQPTKLKHYLQNIPKKRDSAAEAGSSQQPCKVCLETGFNQQSSFFCMSCPDQAAFCKSLECFVNYHKKMGYPLLTVPGPGSGRRTALPNFKVKSLKFL